MSRYDDSEFLTPSPEEVRQQEREEEIRRITRTEIRRVQSGQADEDIAEDLRREEQEALAKTPKPLPRWVSILLSITTGEILIKENMMRGYNHLFIIALLFLGSILLLFSSLHLEIKRDRIKKEVTLLHERAVRTKEQFNKHTSHSAIVERLRERGIQLCEREPSSLIIIKEKK